MTTTQQAAEDDQNTKRSRTVVWVVTIATIGLIFDGYDLVVYGAVVSTFLKDPSQIGEVTPALAGSLGSYALIGTLVGALLAGSVGDLVGRRKVMNFSSMPELTWAYGYPAAIGLMMVTGIVLWFMKAPTTSGQVRWDSAGPTSTVPGIVQKNAIGSR